jgi:hypothetical protein
VVGSSPVHETGRCDIDTPMASALAGSAFRDTDADQRDQMCEMGIQRAIQETLRLGRQRQIKVNLFLSSFDMR